MFCVIYRAWVLDGHEDRYQIAWKIIANYFIQSRGALGSSLHKTEEGYWLAYSRWPDKQLRDASWSTEGEPSTELPAEIHRDRAMPDPVSMVIRLDFSPRLADHRARFYSIYI